MNGIGTRSLCVALRRGLLGLLFPARCALCGASLPPAGPGGLCGPCRGRLPAIRQPYCPRCGRQVHGAVPVPFDTPCGGCRVRPPRFGTCRSAGRYEGSLRECVHLMKFGDRRDLAEPLGAFMAESFARECPGASYDALVPVPISPERRRERGFNQSLDLARVLGRRAGIAVEKRALARRGGRPSQRALSRAQRRLNVRGEFAVPDPRLAAGRRLLLVDDVYTTGATAAECVSTLLAAGAAGVDVYTLARGE